MSLPTQPKDLCIRRMAGEKFADNPKYLFLEAQDDPEIRPVWITKILKCAVRFAGWDMKHICLAA